MSSELYEALESYAGDHVLQDVVRPWLPRLREALRIDAHLRTWSPRQSTSLEGATWHFYALSRIYDWLVLSMQCSIPGAAERKVEWACTARTRSGRGQGWSGPEVDVGDLATIFSELGFQEITERNATYRESSASAFHPFFHEIVAIEEDPRATTEAVTKVWWPGWLWGSMLFARAG